MWPNGVNTDCTEFVSASLTGSADYDSCQVHVKFSLSVIDNNGKKCYENSKDNSSIIENSYDGFNQFIPKKDLETETSNILRNGVLTVYCELTVVYKNSLNNIDESIQQQPFYCLNKLSSAFERQFQKQEFSDVKIVACCGRELPAHKFVLAALSPVFSAMFTNDMIEKNDNSVVVKDLDYDSLREMLRFMYTGNVENLAKLSGGILAAQEKYQIDGLKELCEEYFFQNINVENAVEIIALSIRFNIVKTKSLAEKFIRCHAKDVSQSAAFKAIDESDLLAAIVYILVSE